MNESANEKKSMLGTLGRAKATEAEVEEIRDRLDQQRNRFDEQRKRLDGQQERFDGQRDRLDKSSKSQERLKAEIERQSKKVEKAQESVSELRTTLAAVEKSDRLREIDLRRSMQQLAVLEERVALLEQRLGESFSAEEGDQAEARALVDVVRREHDQVRVRFQVITSYEERLRRIEAAVTKLYDGDDRHPL